MFDPARGYPAVVPYVRYRDPAAAVSWLGAVLGARLAVRFASPEGRLLHGELRVGDQVVAIGLTGGDAVRPPATRDAVRAMTLVFVPDVDAATAVAVELGGLLVDPATDMPWGVRQSVVADPEGHVWELSTFREPVAAADWGAERVGEWFDDDPAPR